MDHAHATTIVYIPGKKEKASTKKEADISVFVNEDITNLTIRRNKPKDLKATCTFEKAEIEEIRKLIEDGINKKLPVTITKDSNKIEIKANELSDVLESVKRGEDFIAHVRKIEEGIAIGNSCMFPTRDAFHSFLQMVNMVTEN